MTNTVTSAAHVVASARRDSIGRRVMRKLKRRLQSIPGQCRVLLVRALYMAPGFRHRNPRRRIKYFRSYCNRWKSDTAVSSDRHTDFYIAIRPSEVVQREEIVGPDAHQTALFAAAVSNHQQGLTITLPEVFVAGLARGRIYSRDYFLLTPDGDLLFESTLSRHDYLDRNGVMDRLGLPPPQRLPGRYILLTTRSHSGYYHWMMDTIPKLSLIEQFPEMASLPIVMPPKLTTFQRETLRLLGVRDSRIICLQPGYWEADQVIFPEILGPTGNPSPHAVSWLRERFLPVARSAESHPPRRIYLTRRDATKRRVLNEDELIRALKPLGFEMVCASDLTLAEQIALFRQVEFVVAPHGAGLTNMVFAPSGACFVELFGDNYLNGCFWALANIRRQHHAFVVGPASWLDYTVEVSQVISEINRLDSLDRELIAEHQAVTPL